VKTPIVKLRFPVVLGPFRTLFTEATIHKGYYGPGWHIQIMNSTEYGPRGYVTRFASRIEKPNRRPKLWNGLVPVGWARKRDALTVLLALGTVVDYV